MAIYLLLVMFSLGFKAWNSMRIGGPTNGIVTKTIHKTLPGGSAVGGLGVVGGQGSGWEWWWCLISELKSNH